LVAQDGWEWVERTNTSGAVVVVAITEDQHLLLVEQYRIPTGCPVIEMPAGLAGDTADFANEAMAEAARRELLEETGYQADRMELLVEGPSSAGLTNEYYSMFLARNVRQVGAGGGDASEKILVHLVALDTVEAWLDQKRREGAMIDPRIYAGLYFAAKTE
jgi:ADP-ribose pyrophosphatase